jgi:hypothetical protein
MNITIDQTLSIKDFIILEVTCKKAIYQKANESHNIALVRQLNDLGMRPKLLTLSGPTIISNFMDIATKHDIILDFFKKLRETNRVLTINEFQDFYSKKEWFKKSNLTRMLGADYLIQIIKKNQLTHIKIPLKVAVIEDTESLKIKGREYLDNLYAFDSRQIKIYAEKISSVERKLSREEIDEFIQIIAAANFSDLRPENIIVAKAEDGVYLIDTEFKSFAGSICWDTMRRFEALISEKDKVYFNGRVQEKMNEPKINKENNGYDFLKDELEVLNEVSVSHPEKYKDKIEKIKNKMLELEYVGAEKAGTLRTKANKFTFNSKDILT